MKRFFMALLLAAAVGAVIWWWRGCRREDVWQGGSDFGS